MMSGWLFWLVLGFLIWRLTVARGRRRRWERKGMSGRFRAVEPVGGGTLRELEEQRSYVDALETRVSELEERLDFTERLLAGRNEIESARQV